MQRARSEKDVAKMLGIRQRVLAEIRLSQLEAGTHWAALPDTGVIEYTEAGIAQLGALLKLELPLMDEEKKDGQATHVAGAGDEIPDGGDGKGASPVMRSLLLVRLNVPNRHTVIAWMADGSTAAPLRVRVKDKAKLRVKQWIKCRHVEADLWEMVGKGDR